MADFEKWADKSFIYLILVILSIVSILALFGLSITAFIKWELKGYMIRAILTALVIPAITYYLYKKAKYCKNN